MAERTCILSGKTLPRERLIRFVTRPYSVAVADLTEKQPGRGAWVVVDVQLVQSAADTGVQQRRVGSGSRYF